MRQSSVCNYTDILDSYLDYQDWDLLGDVSVDQVTEKGLEHSTPRAGWGYKARHSPPADTRDIRESLCYSDACTEYSTHSYDRCVPNFHGVTEEEIHLIKTEHNMSDGRKRDEVDSTLTHSMLQRLPYLQDSVMVDRTRIWLQPLADSVGIDDIQADFQSEEMLVEIQSDSKSAASNSDGEREVAFLLLEDVKSIGIRNV